MLITFDWYKMHVETVYGYHVQNLRKLQVHIPNFILNSFVTRITYEKFPL